MAELIAALLLAAVLGGAAHRAGLCTIKAVAEVLHARRARVAWSFAKAALWTAGLLALAAVLGFAPQLSMRPVEGLGLAGGLLFGMGAGLNGACSFSTLSRLAEGQAVMALTVAGWFLGAAVVGPAPVVPGAAISAGWALPLGLWMAWEAGVIWRGRRDWPAGRRDGLWPLAPSVLLIAAANVGLILLGHRWSFTSTVMCLGQAQGQVRGCGEGVALSAAALVAMLGSALKRGSFRLDMPDLRGAARHLVAGLAMGLGAGLIPGGNDGLILFGLPPLSPHALPDWLAIVLGIALMLTLLRAAGRPIARIRCEGDFCRTEM